jgi:transposase
MGLVIKDDGWRIPDALWNVMELLLPPRKPHRFGGHNPRVPDRDAMNAILFLLRTGCQWNSLDGTGICSCSSAYRRFREWTDAGVFLEFWKQGLRVYDGEKTIRWKWNSMDGAMSKAPLGGEKDGAKPHGSGKARHQAKHADRRTRSGDRSGRRRRQSK